MRTLWVSRLADVQVKSVAHCCPAGAYATGDFVQRSGLYVPAVHVDPFASRRSPDEGYAECMISGSFGNVTEAATFAGTGSPDSTGVRHFEPGSLPVGFHRFLKTTVRLQWRRMVAMERFQQQGGVRQV